MTGPRSPRPLGWSAIVLAFVVLAGCATLPRANGGDAVSVSYERHGGIAGGSTRLTVTPGGRATLDSRAGGRQVAWTRTLPADEWRALHSALDDARFATLKARYRASDTCNDCFVDTVRYGGRTVTVEGVAPPGRLAEVLRLLEALAARE
jgi:hypothetical protein